MAVSYTHLVLYAVLGFVRGLLRLEVYQTAGVLPVFQQVDNGICRPFALITGVVAAGAARHAVFQRPRRGDLLLRQHTGNLGRAVPGKAKLVSCFLAGGRGRDTADSAGFRSCVFPVPAGSAAKEKA